MLLTCQILLNVDFEAKWLYFFSLVLFEIARSAREPYIFSHGVCVWTRAAKAMTYRRTNKFFQLTHTFSFKWVSSVKYVALHGDIERFYPTEIDTCFFFIQLISHVNRIFNILFCHPRFCVSFIHTFQLAEKKCKHVSRLWLCIHSAADRYCCSRYRPNFSHQQKAHTVNESSFECITETKIFHWAKINQQINGYTAKLTCVCIMEMFWIASEMQHKSYMQSL